MGTLPRQGPRGFGYGFDELGLDKVVGIYEPDNVASGAVVRRLGFTLERATTHPALGVRLHVASLARTAWLAR